MVSQKEEVKTDELEVEEAQDTALPENSPLDSANILGLFNRGTGDGKKEEEEKEEELDDDDLPPLPSKENPYVTEVLRERLARFETNEGSLPIEEMLSGMGYETYDILSENRRWNKAVAETEELRKTHVNLGSDSKPRFVPKENKNGNKAAAESLPAHLMLPQFDSKKIVAEMILEKEKREAREWRRKHRKKSISSGVSTEPEEMESKEPAVDFLVASQSYIDQTDPDTIFRRNLLVQFLTPDYELLPEKQDEVLKYYEQNGVKASGGELISDAEVFRAAFLYLTSKQAAKEKFDSLLGKSSDPKYEALKCLIHDGYKKWGSLRTVRKGGG
jgi:hypothetical protein